MPESNNSLADLLEIKRRREIRNGLDAWCRACDLIPALHHQLVNRKLEAVERGEIKNLAIFMPPGSAKSTYSTIQFPPWYLAKMKGRAVLATSHNKDLITSFGRRSRNLIDLHEKELDVRLASDSQAADTWELSNGSYYLCAGVGAGIAGRRADLFIGDDVIGKKEDADSKLYRDKLWQWFRWDVVPRLKPNASKILIQTRWHEDDMAGRLFNKSSPFYEGDKWEIINIPLIAEDEDVLGREPGALLWPEWFTQDMVNEARKDPDAFNSLYQQNPTPAEGNYFNKDWLQVYSPGELPANLRHHACSDHALGKREESDETVLLPFGVDTADNLWILPDVIWGKLDTLEVAQAMLDMNKRYRPINWWAGKEHITMSVGPFLNKMMQEQNNYIPLIETPSRRDLVSRAQPIKGRMAARKVFFPGYAHWWPKAKSQLLSFDRGVHDDFVAALSEAGRGLADMFSAVVPSGNQENGTARQWTPSMKWVRDSARVRARAEAVRLADR